jgi:hypothetical protein
VHHQRDEKNEEVSIITPTNTIVHPRCEHNAAVCACSRTYDSDGQMFQCTDCTNYSVNSAAVDRSGTLHTCSKVRSENAHGHTPYHFMRTDIPLIITFM